MKKLLIALTPIVLVTGCANLNFMGAPRGQSIAQQQVKDPVSQYGLPNSNGQKLTINAQIVNIKPSTSTNIILYLVSDSKRYVVDTSNNSYKVGQKVKIDIDENNNYKIKKS